MTMPRVFCASTLRLSRDTTVVETSMSGSSLMGGRVMNIGRVIRIMAAAVAFAGLFVGRRRARPAGSISGFGGGSRPDYRHGRAMGGCLEHT